MGQVERGAWSPRANLVKQSLLAFALLLGTPLLAAEAPPRARPPQFSAEDRAAFFDNAFDQLVGPRPDYGSRSQQTATPQLAETGKGNKRWSDLIDEDTLETEIKRQAKLLSEATDSSAGYRAAGYRQASDALGLLSVLFAVTQEHDGQPRWRDTAAGLRDLLGESSFEADAQSESAFKLASRRSADLQDLVRGGRPDTPDPAAEVDWSELADRGGLMRRMAAAEEERLRGWVADRREFRRNAEDVAHEARILALLADAIVMPGAYDGDDSDYQAYARKLREAATRLAAAADDRNHEAAQRELPALTRSCVECHGDYRG